jgi:UDP-N-acetylmuramoyl-tripeptide--D-alanyl-D-alanine ligase
VTSLWAISELLEATGGRLLGDAPAGIGGLSIDSRTVGPGDAFFAIAGPNFDGHDFAAAALTAGAALAVVGESRAPPGATPLLVVPDEPLAALRRLAAAARARMRGRVVAVTGSVGKTGTTAMLRLALSAGGATHAPVGSFNNHWGVPLTLARMPAESAHAVFEIGMNHAGEIRPLTKLVRPHVAVITTVEPVHLEFFAGEEDIAEAKAEIFEGAEPGATAVLNRDNRWFGLLAERARERGARVVTFGEHREADLRLDDVVADAEGSTVRVAIGGALHTYRIGAPGRHHARNSLAALAAARSAGVAVDEAMLALTGFRAPKGRGERVALSHPGGVLTLIDESYNANPASMRAALALLGEATPAGRGRRIAVLGDMRELGKRAPILHRELAEPVETSGADVVFLAGPLMRELWEVLPPTRRGAYAENAAALEPILLEALGPGDVVMIKASLGTRFGPLAETLKRRFGGALPPTSVGRPGTAAC